MNAALLAELLAAQQVLALQRRAADSFTLTGRAPDWFAACALEDFSPGEPFAPAALFPYLDVFLPDAESFWQQPENGPRRSGWWTQTGRDGRAGQFEAVAHHLPEGDFLFIRKLEADYEERQRLLQRGRELLLEHEKLLKEIDAKEVLLHCIVHDLNGPLSGMTATLEALARENLSERGRRFAELGQGEARKQLGLIRDLLDVFAAEMDALQNFSTDPSAAPDIVACARSAVEGLTPAFAQKEAGVQLRLAPGFPAVCRVAGDQSKLERVFYNLIENALRFTPRGRGVVVELREDGAFIHAAILDEGPGLPPEIASQLFQKFVKGRNGGGKSGLGLFFCRITVERWGGSVGSAPRPGGGTCFWFRVRRV